jgi:hypothetical protein
MASFAPLMKNVVPSTSERKAVPSRAPRQSTNAARSFADRADNVEKRPPIVIGESSSPLEVEAHRHAHEVARGSTAPTIARTASPPVKARGADAPASVHRVLAGPGSALVPGLQQEMSLKFRHDFSRVRVHAGEDAARSASDVGANAYTVGEHVVFGAGRFGPDTPDGRRLIAHELTHVVQQSRAGRIGNGGRARRGFSSATKPVPRPRPRPPRRKGTPRDPGSKRC